MKFNQKKLGEHRNFEILEDSLKVITRKDGVYNELFIKFENITDEIRFIEARSVIILIFSFISFFSSLYLLWINMFSDIFKSTFDGIMSVLIFIIIGILGLMIFLFVKDADILLMCSDNTGISFFYDKPNKKDVKGFIELIILKKNKYMKEKYTYFDEAIGIDQYIANLYTLRQTEVITDNEYLNLKKACKKNTNRIGF